MTQNLNNDFNAQPAENAEQPEESEPGERIEYPCTKGKCIPLGRTDRREFRAGTHRETLM